MPNIYYFDTCVWINLFKNEVSLEGKPFWKAVEAFIYSLPRSDKNLVYSGIVLKELRFKLGNEQVFEEKERFIKEELKLSYVKFIPEDYSFARRLESKVNFVISFYDCLHIAICLRLDMILVTRDRELIEIARGYIVAKSPEDLVA